MEKYSTIIANRSDRDYFVEHLQVLSSAFEFDKVKIMMKAVGVSSSSKVDFLLDICKADKKEFINFLKVLVLNKNLDLIPTIYNQLVKKIALEQGVYYSEIYSKNVIQPNELTKYEDKLSAYFNKKIKLKNIIHDKDEVKVYLEDLGYEIIISNNFLREKLRQYIMKVI